MNRTMQSREKPIPRLVLLRQFVIVADQTQQTRLFPNAIKPERNKFWHYRALENG